MGERVNIVFGDAKNPAAILFSNSHHPDVDAEKALRQAIPCCKGITSLINYLLTITYPSDWGGHYKGQRVFMFDEDPGDYEKVLQVNTQLKISDVTSSSILPQTTRMDKDSLFAGIEGPLFKQQRQVLSAIIDNGHLPADKNELELLEGLRNLLDCIADVAHDEFGKDTLFLSSEQG